MLELWGAIFIIVAGTLFHFMYDWSNHNKIVGYFMAVNESTWEHLKLIIAPAFIWLIIDYHFYCDNPMFYISEFISILVMIWFIPLVFYSYKHFLKRPILAIDISSFILAAILGKYIFYLLININYSNLILKHIGIIGLAIIFFRYITRTYVPNKNFLHKDPITNKYGIKGHGHEDKI